MDRYFVRNDVTGEFVSGVTLSRVPLGISHQVFFVTSPGIAVSFNYEEAQALINFINDVIDWELAEDLFVVSAEELISC